MMRRRLVVGAGISFALLAAGSGAAVGAANHARGSSRGLFAGQMLLPGESAHADITVMGARAPVRPYLEISAVRQRCTGAACTSAAPALAKMLQLSAGDGAGRIWTGTIAAAQRRVALPGGTIAAGHRRTYHLTLSLPARADNSYEGLIVSGHFSWGGTDASGHTVSSTPDDRDHLPFTGLEALGCLPSAAACSAPGAAFSPNRGCGGLIKFDDE
jgi:hypothetical protein